MKNFFTSSLIVVSVLTTASAWALTYDKNVPEAIQSQMQQDLAFMGTVEGAQTTGLHTQIFGAMKGASYQNWFEARIFSVGLSDCGNPNAVACVSPFQDENKMWLTQNFIKFSHPQISRMMVVYHEARHSEGKNRWWMHAKCPTPFKDENGKDMTSIWTKAQLAGQPACDKTPLGSYGSSTIMLRNISKYCTTCTDKVRMDAKIYSDDQLERIIDASAKNQIKNDE